MPSTRASDALERLKQGNLRFVQDRLESAPGRTESRRQELLDGQKPFAAVLGCIDSRVPVELVFDVGFGDLMVSRVAGNYISSAVVASLEFSAAAAQVPLIVVLGHSKCGAIRLALEKLENPAARESDHLQELIDQIGPCFDGYLAAGKENQRPAALAAAVAANVRSSVRKLGKASDAIAELVAAGKLLIVGAQYCLESGAVEFFPEHE